VGGQLAGAWTTLGEDLIVCVLQDVLSKGEQNLVRNGSREEVLRTRRASPRTGVSG
jgi:uncharacterized protein YbcI